VTQLRELPDQRLGRPVFTHHEHLVATARTGPHDELSITEILALLPDFMHRKGRWHGDHGRRNRGISVILEWLTTFPGSGWQERWLNSGADTGVAWMATLAASDPRLDGTVRDEMRTGMVYLLACQVVLPGYGYLHACKLWAAMSAVRRVITPELFARAQLTAKELGIEEGRAQRIAMNVLTKIVMHTGRGLDKVTEEDLFEYRSSTARAYGVQAAWQILATMGILAEDSTMRAALHLGQTPTSELVDSYRIQDRGIRDVLVRYLEERRPGLDYNSFRSLVSILCRNFWCDIERHHPGISSLHLPAEVATGWKERISRVELKDGTSRERKNRLDVLMKVRAFYLDIREWALEDASWAQWAMPCPVRRGDLAGTMKRKRATRAEIHQRIRHRLPQLPVVVDTAETRWRNSVAMLQKAAATAVGDTFDHDGRAYERLGCKQFVNEDGSAQSGTISIRELGTDDCETTEITREEDEAFWAWAIIETLRLTGVRVEELLEITHLALVTHRLADTGEVVPLLQIVPSKSNEERLLLVVPELASVLATIVHRIRGEDGQVPLVARYDGLERTMGPKLPHLFQRRTGWRREVISVSAVKTLLDATLSHCGLTDQAGQPLRFTPHDFRRIFTTEAVTGGLPVHIAARILGHDSLDTTQSYLAVFQDELIRSYRAFVNSRRALRPAAEYREPTEEEWREFQMHWELRKVELGDCGRPYGTPCVHEHACIRCAMLRVDPRQKGRLAEIINNLKERISEAKANGWGGEVQGLRVSLDGAQAKMASLIRAERNRQAGGLTDLGMPRPRPGSQP
jgi:integrase-like protein